MRHTLCLALAVAAVLVLPRTAQAQIGIHPSTSRVFAYNDSDGPGQLVIDDVGPSLSAPGARFIRVFLTQGGESYWGSGTWVPLGNAQVTLNFTVYGGSPPFSYQFSGILTTGFGGTSGQGTYHQVGFPYDTNQWTVTQTSGGGIGSTQ